MFVLVTELQPFGLDERVVLDGGGPLREPKAEFLFFGRVHTAGAGSGIGLDERYDCHRGGGVGGNGEFDEKAFVKGLAVAVDRLIHQQSALAINDVAAAVILVTAEDMGMLDDDGVRTYLDHEAAGVLDTWAGDQKLIAAMKQDNQVIELVAVTGDVANEVDEVKWIGAGGVLGGDGELMLGDGEKANPEATQVSDEDSAGGIEVWSGTDGLDAGLGADRKSILEAGGTVVEDVVIGQVKNINAGLFDAIDTRARFAKSGPGFLYGRLLLDEQALEVGDSKIGLLELRKQIVQKACGISIDEVWTVSFDRTDVCPD
jgi:hypothetical protein